MATTYHDQLTTPTAFLDRLNITLWVVFSAIIFALIHSSSLRANLARTGRTMFRSLRKAFIDFPLFIARHETLNRVLTSAPVMALFYVLQKHLVGGLTTGSVKG